MLLTGVSAMMQSSVQIANLDVRLLKSIFVRFYRNVRMDVGREAGTYPQRLAVNIQEG